VRVKLVLPALTEAVSPYFRPIKYSLFPPLGLATLAAYLGPADEVSLQDEHVEALDLDDEPDLVVIQVYITSALRSYRIADHYRRKGARVVLGGLHVTSLPDEAAPHADTIFLGPGEDTWPAFLLDLRAGRPRPRYVSRVRTLAGLPPIRRDLIKRHLYLVPNSIVVSRGCPHRCDFCYKEAFFEGGKGFYTQAVDRALAEIDRLPGRHVYFLDDHLFGDPRFASALFHGMRGMGRLWQAAGTVASVLRPGLLEKAVACGLRSLFVGFETLNPAGLAAQGKHQNLRRDYGAAIRRLHDLGVMVNGSFVFGMDEDDASVFERTVTWAVDQGIETATFHILTPYPGTALYKRMEADGRLWHRDWDLYDTRHVVFATRGMSAEQLQAGYWRAYRDFYRWGSILRGAGTKATFAGRLRHVAYAGGWKKLEPLWDWVIRTRRVCRMLPVLESVLEGFGARRGSVESTREDAAVAREVDVPAGDDTHDLAGPGSAGQGHGHRARPRALGDDPVALGEEPHRARHLAQRDHEGSGEERAGSGQHVGKDGLASDAVHERAPQLDGLGYARLEGARQGRGGLHLRGEHASVRTPGPDRGRDSRGESPTSPGGHDGVGVREVFEDLETDGAVAGHHVDVVERVDEGAFDTRDAPGLERPPPLVEGDLHDAPAQARHGLELGVGGGLRGEHGAGEPPLPRPPGDALGHVPRGGGHDALRQLARREARDRVRRAADLERAGGLQVLELQEDVRGPIDEAQADERSPDRRLADGAPGLLDLGQ
jgi:radical SAM superfamily enzyme YgiQ (UPF0313 family)